MTDEPLTEDAKEHERGADHVPAPPITYSDSMTEIEPPGPHAIGMTAFILSAIALGVSVLCSVVYIILLVLYANDAFSGDGFMLPMPVMCWLFLVLPLCGIAGGLTVVGCCMKNVKQRWGVQLTMILLALPLLPLLLLYAVFEIARWP